MKSIADELAVAQSLILEEDLVVHILTQLGDELNNIVAAIKVRESLITLAELFDKVTDFERMLKDNELSQSTILATANVTQKSNFRFQPNSKPFNQIRSNGKFSNFQKFHDNTNRNGWQNQGSSRTNRSNLSCQFCEINGHDTHDCRKLARFLKDNDIHVSGLNKSKTSA